MEHRVARWRPGNLPWRFETRQHQENPRTSQKLTANDIVYSSPWKDTRRLSGTWIYTVLPTHAHSTSRSDCPWSSNSTMKNMDIHSSSFVAPISTTVCHYEYLQHTRPTATWCVMPGTSPPNTIEATITNDQNTTIARIFVRDATQSYTILVFCLLPFRFHLLRCATLSLCLALSILRCTCLLPSRCCLCLAFSISKITASAILALFVCDFSFFRTASIALLVSSFVEFGAHTSNCRCLAPSRLSNLLQSESARIRKASALSTYRVQR